MSSTRVAIIVGGLILSSSLLLLMVQIVLAGDPPPVPGLSLRGTVAVGGQPAGDDTEIRAKAFDTLLNQLVPLQLTDNSVDAQGRHLTRNGTYGEGPDGFFFQMPTDDLQTPEREGAKPLEKIFLVIVINGTEFETRMTDAGGALIPDGVPFTSGAAIVNLSLADTVPPTVPTGLTRILKAPAADNFTDRFVWTRSEDPDPGSGVDFYEAVINPGAITATVPHADCALGVGGCELPVSQLPVPLTPGEYVLSVKAVDKARNFSAAAILEFQEGSPRTVQNLKILNQVFGRVRASDGEVEAVRWPGEHPTGNSGSP